MKILYYAPMVHTQEELGSLKDAIITTREQRYGEAETKQFINQTARYWVEAEKRIQAAGLFQPKIASHLHIFVDSLPDTSKDVIKKIIQELISRDIPVYRIIRKLQENGAIVHGTENTDLLLREYQYWIELSRGKQPNSTLIAQLLQARDHFIAQRLDNMVPDGKIALLFIGRGHDVIGELAKLKLDFKVKYL